MKLGEIVRIRRKQLKKTLQDVSTGVPGYDEGNLSRFERGLQEIDDNKLRFLAKELDCTITELYHALETGDLDFRADINTEITAEVIKLIKWNELINLYENNELPEKFKVEIRFKTGPLSGYSGLIAELAREDLPPPTNLVIGIYQGEADLFRIESDGIKSYFVYANPKQSSTDVEREKLTLLAWIVDGIPIPISDL